MCAARTVQAWRESDAPEVCEMKINQAIGMAALALVAACPVMRAAGPTADAPAQLVITASASKGGRLPDNLTPSDVKVLLNKHPATVVSLQRLAGGFGDMQLFIFLDDSTRSAGLGVHIPELRAFVEALPATTQVAVGYMRNGTFQLAQGFTTDHEIAASAVRLPEAIPGGNGSPYFALSDLVKHWPSKETTDRRAVLMLTDGVDRYYGSQIEDDPYVDQAVQDTLKDSVMVYSIYIRDAGLYDRGGWVTNFAQSRLNQVSDETGGHAYFQAFSDPVTISPFLKDFEERLENQYKVTIEAVNRKGVQPVKLRTELPGVKIQGPTQVFVR
jgi:hypothetical protein